MMLGFDSAFFDVARCFLDKWDLHSAPFFLAEDGTALQMRLSVRGDDDKREVYIFSLSGGSYHVSKYILCFSGYFSVALPVCTGCGLSVFPSNLLD